MGLLDMLTKGWSKNPQGSAYAAQPNSLKAMGSTSLLNSLIFNGKRPICTVQRCPKQAKEVPKEGLLRFKKIQLTLNLCWTYLQLRLNLCSIEKRREEKRREEKMWVSSSRAFGKHSQERPTRQEPSVPSYV